MNESKIALTERLRREGRWAEASKLKDAALAEFRAKGMKRDEASDAAWDAMEKAYPPLAATEAAAVNVRIQGLGEIPASWPELPANASLSAEIGWVQANRLRVVEERPGAATVVRLDRAMAPAPSWAALSWLETSIRSYAKYVEVAAKATSTAQDEQAQVRQEKMRIEEIRALLEEMQDQWAEELLANTSETIRVKVCSLLEDWARRSGLTILGEAKADLAGHVCELVDECVGILAPSAEGE
jgi:hypothetical protein